MTQTIAEKIKANIARKEIEYNSKKVAQRKKWWLDYFDDIRTNIIASADEFSALIVYANENILDLMEFHETENPPKLDLLSVHSDANILKLHHNFHYIAIMSADKIVGEGFDNFNDWRNEQGLEINFEYSDPYGDDNAKLEMAVVVM